MVVSALSVLLLSGCSLIDGPTPNSPERSTPKAPAGEVTYVEGGSAADNLPMFTKVLVDYGKGTGEVQGEPVQKALTEVGFDPESIEVSQDIDPFGNPAETLFVSSRFGSDCLIGQIVTEDREVAVEEASAIGPNKDKCLVIQPR